MGARRGLRTLKFEKAKQLEMVGKIDSKSYIEKIFETIQLKEMATTEDHHLDFSTEIMHVATIQDCDAIHSIFELVFNAKKNFLTDSKKSQASG